LADQDGAGDGAAMEEAITAAHEDASSLNGFAGAAPQGPVADRPEVLVAAAVLGGLLLARVVSRLGR
jgi:hypothetical protein